MSAQLSLLVARLAVLAACAQPADPEAHDAAAPPREDRAPVLDEKQFARLRATMPDAAFCYFLYCHLLDVEFHLEEIARAATDLSRLSRKAWTLAEMAGEVGAMRVNAAARRLGAACGAGDRRKTARLIGELNRSCSESEMELRRFLAYRARLAGAA